MDKCSGVNVMILDSHSDRPLFASEALTTPSPFQFSCIKNVPFTSLTNGE